MVARETTVRCTDCRELHPAVVKREQDKIVGRFVCGEQEHSAVLTEDAELYERITAKSRVDLSPGAQVPPRRALVNLVEITDTCNFTCPLCYAGCGPLKNPDFASAQYVESKVREVQALGAKGVTLTGGEPTEHPRILELITAVTKLGVRVIITTNGYRIGTEPDFAAALRDAGLDKASIQFDTFDPEVHKLIRGNTFVAEKQQAFENARAAGLRVGMIATVSHLNVAETPELLAFALQQVPVMQTVVFQMAANIGRMKLPEGPAVDREQVIRALVQGGVVPGMTGDHFWPLPNYRPWGMHVHPDCGANAYVVTRSGKLGLLDELVSLNDLFGRLGRSQRDSSFFSRNAVPGYHLLASARRGKRIAVGRHVRGFLSGKGSHGMLVVGVGGFSRTDFHDQARIDHCATTMATEAGPMSPCVKFH